MVAKWSFGDEWFCRVDVTLEDKIRFGRNLEIAGERFRERHWLLAKEAGEQEFIHRRRERRARRVHRWRVRAERDAYRHALTALGHLTPVRGPNFMALPVHGQRRSTRLHDSIHPDVSNSAFGIARDDHRERDVCAAV